MPRVIVEVSGGVARVESSSDEVDVVLFDWDELSERCGAEKCAAIQSILDNGESDRARQLVDAVYNGQSAEGLPWPEEVRR